MISGLTNSDAIPVLEAAVRFAGRRHDLIAHNVANLSTPNFRPVDLDVAGFESDLREAIEARRSRWGVRGGPLGVPGGGDGEAEVRPLHHNILFHDRNDRDVERTMQLLVTNFMQYRAASQLLRSRFALLERAISERL